jgi:hypothetical protein
MLSCEVKVLNRILRHKPEIFRNFLGLTTAIPRSTIPSEIQHFLQIVGQQDFLDANSY